MIEVTYSGMTSSVEDLIRLTAEREGFSLRTKIKPSLMQKKVQYAEIVKSTENLIAGKIQGYRVEERTRICLCFSGYDQDRFWKGAIRDGIKI